jgi:hypothetical protein
LSLALGLLSAAAQPQSSFPNEIATHSQSGQFVVQGHRSGEGVWLPRNLATNENLLPLEPTLVSISCERIKQSLLRELQATPAWKSKIYIFLYPTRSENEPVNITSTRFRDGWQYRLDMPNLIERTKYVQAIVQVLLLEMANRNADEHSAEIPLWLTAGFAEQLRALGGKEILLRPPVAAVNKLGPPATFINEPGGNPLDSVQKFFGNHAALNLQQLSWPTADELTGEPGQLYRYSAQLFLSELMALEHGPARVRRMVEQLPQYYNWQFAMLDAFKSDFPRLLDVEKWWTLHALYFAAHGLAQTWPPQQSWEKLEESLHVPVEFHSGTNDLPLHTVLPLQAVIRDWDQTQQTEALLGKLRELEVLRLRVAPALAPLVDDYRQTLETFLQDRNHTGLIPFRGKTVAKRASDEAIQRLDALDAKRQELRPSTEAIESARK